MGNPSVIAGLDGQSILFREKMDARERGQVYAVRARQTTMPAHDNRDNLNRLPDLRE
jgi:hypothetical protein